MMVLLILAPFGSFALLILVTSATVALFAAAAICLAELLRQMRRIAADQYSPDLVSEPFHFTKLRFAVKGYRDMKTFRS